MRWPFVDRTVVLVMALTLAIVMALGGLVFGVNQYFHNDSVRRLGVNQYTTIQGVNTLICWQIRNSTIKLAGFTQADLQRYQRESVRNLNTCLGITGFSVDPRVRDP